MEERKIINITLTPYGCGMIMEAMRVLAENDESLRVDALHMLELLIQHLKKQAPTIGEVMEVWQGYGGKIITDPEGTFYAIWNDDEEEDDDL